MKVGFAVQSVLRVYFMCTQRLYLIMFVWFLIHLLSITPIQCKRHRRSLNQHCPYNLSHIRKNGSELNSSFQIESINSVTFPIISDWPQYMDILLDENGNSSRTMRTYPNLKTSEENVEEELAFLKNAQNKLQTSNKLREVPKGNKNINSTEHRTYPDSHIRSSQSENDQLKNLGIQSSKIQQEKTSFDNVTKAEHTIFKESEENPKIPLRVKRSCENNFLTNSSDNKSELGKKTLLDLEGPTILEDLNNVIDQDNLVHIRVKRDNPNKDNIVPNFKSSYLKDLDASFPKSELELEEGTRLASNKVENERLFKRSFDLETEDNLDNPTAVELNQNLKKRDERIHTSKENFENQQDPRFKENSGYLQGNLYSDLEDEDLKRRKKRHNYGKIYPESYSMEDEISQSVAQIANNRQKNNVGEDVSYEYVNDNQEVLQNPYQEDNKVIDSMLSKIDYEALNGDQYEKMNQENIQNDASNQQNLVNDNLYSPEALQPEANCDDSKSVEGELLNPEETKATKDDALEEASMRFPGREVRLNAVLRNRRAMKPLMRNKNNKRRSKKKKSKKFNKKHKKKRGHRNSLKKHSNQNSLIQLDKVIGDLQVESKIEKRDSTEGRTEVDIARRDVSSVIKLDDSEKFKSSNISSNDQKFETSPNETIKDENEQVVVADRNKRDTQKKLQNSSVLAKEVNKSLKKVQESTDSKERVKRKENEDKQCIRPAGQENVELKYYENIYEPKTTYQTNISKLNIEPEGTTLKNGTIKSVEEIKTLVEKLVAKVNELRNFVGINVNKRGKKATEIQKKLSPEQISKSIKRCMALETRENTTSKISTKCKLNRELDTVLQVSKDQEKQQFLEGEKKTESNRLIQLRPEKKPKEVRERKRSRRKRKSHRKWDRWTDWSSCSVTCGKGRQIRWRHCISECHIAETEMEEKACQLPACPPGKFLGLF